MLTVAGSAQLRPQFSQFPPQLLELLPQIPLVATRGRALATSVVALGHFAHQLLGPLPQLVSKIGEPGRFEVSGGNLQVLGPLGGG